MKRVNAPSNQLLSLSPSDERLPGGSDHPPVFHRDVSFPLLPGGFPLRGAPPSRRGAAVPPRASRGRNHAQREETRGEQQQRRAVQMWSCRGQSVTKTWFLFTSGQFSAPFRSCPLSHSCSWVKFSRLLKSSFSLQLFSGWNVTFAHKVVLGLSRSLIRRSLQQRRLIVISSEMTGSNLCWRTRRNKFTFLCSNTKDSGTEISL